MARKKVPNIAARFGPRYGATLRKRWNMITLKKKKKYECPRCMSKSLRWVSVGIWSCRKCGYTFAGGAYEPFVMRKREII